jgi:hypothetical protein
VKPILNCALEVRIEEGMRGRWGKTAAAALAVMQGRGAGGGRWCRQEGPTCQRANEKEKRKRESWADNST